MTDLLERLRSALADRYRVERELGRGGMATVFAADDLKHHRRVAIKVLDVELAAASGAERFRREIETVASLTHPHILPLHDSGLAGGLPYFVMPLVDGASLRARLEREGRLPVDDAVRLGEQVAGALDYAHRRGVVHRDIKPENILLSDAAAVVTDFGIAVALGPRDRADLTQTGMMLGTPRYMSPEQVTGAHPVDARSDIYALGVVLHEMIAGEPPFSDPSPAAWLTRKLTEQPASLRGIRAGVPDPVADAVTRALAHDPADRFASAAEFGAALRSVSGRMAALPRSVLVLPFANVSPDRDNEYFADGLTDELIGDLSKLAGLRVICRTSAMACRADTRDARAIAEDLGVAYVVEGSVRRAGDRLRVTARLVEARTNVGVWSERYDGVLDDVFAIQERLARTIAAGLELQLTPDEHARLGARPIADVHAHECYLRARQQLWRWRRDAIDHARQILANGVRIVGDNALLYATMASAHLQTREAGIDLSDAPIAAAEALTRRAAELDPDLPQVALLNGWLHWSRGCIPEAIHHLRAAVDADPGNADTLGVLANCYLISGQMAHARPVAAKFLAVDPLNPMTRTLSGYIDVLEGRFDDAAIAYREMFEMDPANPMARLFYGWSLALGGRRDEACDVLGGFEADVEASIGARLGACMRAALTGEVHDDLPRIAAELDAVEQLPDMFARFVGWCYGPLGDAARTTYWLRVGADRGFINYPFLARFDTLTAPVRHDPAFQALLADVRARWERFDA